MTPVTGVYRPNVDEKMRKVFDSFSQKDQRRHAAAEVIKIGHGGTACVARLNVAVRVITTLCEAGRKPSKAFKNPMPIQFDDVLPKWNS